jgi:chromosome partitioning protein
MTRRLLISTLKGGPGKTTTTFLLALGWARRDRAVVAIDADTRSQTLTAWARRAQHAGAAVPFTVVSWRGRDQDGELVNVAKRAERDHQADIVLIDTGGEAPDVFMSGCLYASRLLAPVGPMPAELDRMHATRDAAASIDEAKRDGILMSALLTRVPQPGRGAATDARAYLVDPAGLDLHVMSTEITRQLALYADVYGTIPDNIGEYDQLIGEIEKEATP